MTPPTTPLTPWTPSLESKTFPTINLSVSTRIPTPPVSESGTESRLFSHDRLGFGPRKSKVEAAPLQQTQRRQLRHKRSHSHCPRGLGISNELLPLHDINDSPLRSVSPSHRPHRSVINAPISSASSDKSGKLASLLNFGEYADVTQLDDFDIQEALVFLAYKERQVLEARQALSDTESELEEFRTRIYSMLGPKHENSIFSGRLQVISRHLQHNVGVNSLVCKSCLPSSELNHSISWDVDTDVPASSKASSYVESHNIPNSRPSLSLRFIHCLLGIVHCIISTLPTYQAKPRIQSSMRLEYPSPMATLYGFHFSLEI